MEDLLTASDLSQKWKVSSVWIYKLVREKRIPFVHVERCVRFVPSQVEEWLKERENKGWSLCHRTRGRV